MNRCRILLVAIGVTVMLPFSAGVAQAAPSNVNEAAASQPIRGEGAGAQGFLIFESATQVYRLTVDLQAGATGTTLAVDTRDCCLIGDHWGVSITVPGTTLVRSACGTGSTAFFTGLAHLGTAKNPLTTSATVTVSYCSGTDEFAAGMEVRFRYNGDGLTVTPQA